MSRGPQPTLYAGDGYDCVYDIPERSHFLPQGQEYTHSRYIEEDNDDRRRSVDDDDNRTRASSRRSHGTHRTKRSHTTRSGTSSRPPLTESNLRTLTEVSSTTPTQVPRTYQSQSPYPESAPRDLAMSRPALVRASTAPSDSILNKTNKKKKKKKEIDMNLAYGNVPPDLAYRTDLGPATRAEEADAARREELKKEAEARALMGRIETLLDEAECVQHTATSIIDHLQRKPEAAAAVALLLAELSTLLKAMSPGFLAVVKGGFPAIFALLASPQFLIGVGVAVGVTVVFFGGWKIVKRIRDARALAADKEAGAQAFEMQGPPATAADGQSAAFRAGAAYGAPGPGSYDDALVLDEELSTIETWRRGISPGPGDGEEEEEEEDDDGESADLELITPSAVRSVRGGDAASVRTHRTHRSSRSHRSRSCRPEDEVADVPARTSSRAHTASRAGDGESAAGSERSRRTAKTARSKTTVRTIEDAGSQRDSTLDAVLRPKEKKSSMLKSIFQKKKENAEGRDVAVSVMA